MYISQHYVPKDIYVFIGVSFSDGYDDQFNFARARFLENFLY